MSLVINPITVFPLPIKIDCPIAKGEFIGKAKIRSKPEIQALAKRLDDGEFEDDISLIRELFEDFEGLPCDKGQEFQFVTQGVASSYLIPAAIQTYFQQYGEARVGNSKRRLSR